MNTQPFDFPPPYPDRRWLPGPATRLRRRGAFTLVEVTLAVGIMGFAFVAIVGLVPVGLTNFRQTKNASVASQISERMYSEVQNTTFERLTKPGKTWRLPVSDAEGASVVRYFDDQGQELGAYGPTALYQVNVRVASATPFVQPGAADHRPVPPNPDLATVTIQIAYNPGNLPLDLDATSTPTLWTGTSGKATVPIFNRQTCVVRNF